MVCVRSITVLLLAALGAHAQAGAPVRVPFTCAEDDLQFAGMDCTEGRPCAVYLELNAVAALGNKMLAAGNLHSGSSTIASVLLVSDDAGVTWKEPAARLRGSSIEQVQFPDPMHVYAAGELQYPLSADPFFLLSTDGGVFFRQRPVSDEGGPGTIQSFSFDSAQHGELVVDEGKSAPGGRYVSYETRTGGETWMTRSKVAQLPRGRNAAPESDIRVQTGKDGKAWQIERRSGTQWTPVASFLVEAASCPLPQPEPAQPEPAQPEPK